MTNSSDCCSKFLDGSHLLTVLTVTFPTPWEKLNKEGVFRKRGPMTICKNIVGVQNLTVNTVAYLSLSSPIVGRIKS